MENILIAESEGVPKTAVKVRLVTSVVEVVIKLLILVSCSHAQGRIQSLERGGAPF